MGEVSFFELKSLDYSPKRIQILTKVYGNKVEPWDVIHNGDTLEKVIQLYGKPELEDDFEDDVLNNKRTTTKFFQLPFIAPLFPVEFLLPQMKVINVECFNKK